MMAVEADRNTISGGFCGLGADLPLSRVQIVAIVGGFVAASGGFAASRCGHAVCRFGRDQSASQRVHVATEDGQ